MKTLMILAVTEMASVLARTVFVACAIFLCSLHVCCTYIKIWLIIDVNAYCAIQPTNKMAARTLDVLQTLQGNQKNIRNICILAHVDHGML